MKRRWIYVILATFFAVFFLYSCTSPTQNNGSNNETTNNEATNSDVTIVIDRSGANRNATLVLAQDGLEGTWKELTGTNGTYKFTVNNEQGVYSIAAVDEITNGSQIRLFHGTLAEAKTVNIPFAPVEVDYATLTINIPNYPGAKVGVFFLNNHVYDYLDDNGSVPINISKGEGELVIFVYDENMDFQLTKIYLNRDFTLQSSKTLEISGTALENPSQIEGEDVVYGWILDKTIVPAHAAYEKVKIPQDKIKDTDMYEAYHHYFRDYLSVYWTKITKDVPVTIPEGVKTLTPATTTISATGVENNLLPKITFSPYQSEISGYEVKYYKLHVNYNCYITITSGYLAQLSDNIYTFPNITLDNWKNEYNPSGNYVVYSLDICLSPNTIDEMNSLKVESEWVDFTTWLGGL
ncbi:MAG TPA: hypothetical protein DE117_00130 [Fervidobacterium sp.]|nr:hypothetical protein [Fervidobacterium sp.]HRD20824.1 hypothetical protein [Fervidobacterium sp.]